MLTLYLPWFHRDSSVFWARLVAGAWLISWFRGITVAKLCRCFISKPTADSWQLTAAVKFCTHTTKNQKLLFTYINAVVKASWLWYNKNYNLTSVKTRSKEEQCSRSTLRRDQRWTDRTNNNRWLEARTTLSLHAWGQGRTDHDSLEAERGRKMAFNFKGDMNRKCPWLTLDFNYIPYICGWRLANLAKSSQGQTR